MMPPVQYNAAAVAQMDPTGGQQQEQERPLPTCEEAISEVVRGMGDLQYNAGASMTDLIFLRGLMEHPEMRSLVRSYDLLSPDHGLLLPRPASDDLRAAVQAVAGEMQPLASYHPDAKALLAIFNNPNFAYLADTHDQVANRTYGDPLLPQLDALALGDSLPRGGGTADRNGTTPDQQPIRVVGVKKVPGEPLGVTLKVNPQGELQVTRILAGGIIDKQGLLQLNDVVVEINGLPVRGEFLMLPHGDKQRVVEYLKTCAPEINFKVQPFAEEVRQYQTQMFVRALFSYNPEKDDLLSNPELGLSFESGDILEIIESQNDPNWWQARKYEDGSGRARLIPSEVLEERRQSYARPDLIDTKKLKYGGLTSKKRKKKELYSAIKNAEFDRLDLMFYEEVARMPPFPRKTLVLIGATGVGRRTIKNALINAYPDNFAAPLPTTSRPPREGEEPDRLYHFVERSVMEDDIKHNRYLEYGEFGDNWYGTKLDSIHEIIDRNKMAVLDVSPQTLKVLRSAEFMPFVVLIAAPSFDRLRDLRGEDTQMNASTTTLSRLSDRELRKTVEESAELERDYRHFIDLKIVNDDPELTFRRLCEAIQRLGEEHQWVPVSWVY